MTGVVLSAALWGAVSSAAVAGPVDHSPTGSATTAQVSAPLFDSELDRARSFVDRMMKAGVVVPFPKDPGGGYTHEQHKQNFKVIYQGGQLYKLTGEQKYADYVRDVLLAYAKLYPTLGEHPARKNSQGSGRLFWQVLNDAMWMVDSIQGYEAIRSSLSKADRKNIDENLFRKAAEFLSTGSAVTFSKIHNHATWATAGVGMTGFVLGDKELVDIALLGLDKSGETGFLRQSELLFSPDGYYTEGPYYQRFALKPFVVFAGAIEKNDPSRKIFEHRDGILLKALQTTIQLTYAGRFFPFNDAIRDKSLKTDELYHGVAVAYSKTRDPGLLSIAKWQGRTVLTEDGMLVARDLAAGKADAYPFRPLLLSDGPEGKQGAVAIMREGDGWTGSALVAKNSSQGMGHGHFDKLSWQYYDNGYEIVSDYGAARFLNIEAKQGGRYLPENESWAKQSIAHNSLVVDERSHFNGDRKAADKLAPEQLYFSGKSGSQISSAKMTGAYPRVEFTRTLALLDIEGLGQPLVADVMRVEGSDAHQYDLPLHYHGHIMRVGFDVQSNVAGRPVLGEGNGYQHIWVDGSGAPSSADNAFVTWIKDDRFYTARWVPEVGSETILAESGANDPDFNLRREQMLVQRVANAKDTVFAGILEAHGRYDGAAERTTASDSQIRNIQHMRAEEADLLLIETLAGARSVLAISYDRDPSKEHIAAINGENISWKGFAAHVRLKGVSK